MEDGLEVATERHTWTSRTAWCKRSLNGPSATSYYSKLSLPSSNTAIFNFMLRRSCQSELTLGALYPASLDCFILWTVKPHCSILRKELVIPEARIASMFVSAGRLLRRFKVTGMDHYAWCISFEIDLRNVGDDVEVIK